MIMEFKNEETTKCCTVWMKYPFKNAHPLKDERFYNFMYCLCKYEIRIEDENSFLSLLQIEECKRTESELKDAFCKYQVIFDFYQFMKVNAKE